MKSLRRIVFVFIIAIFCGVATARAEDALTPSDYKYLATIGWTQDNDALKNTTAPQKSYLHNLINDPKLASKTKEDKVNGYMVQVSLSQTFEVIDKARKGQ